MGRTWLLRGTAVIVFAVLAVAWGVGVSGLRGSGSPAEDRPPAPPGSSTVPESERSVAPEKVKAPRIRKVARTPDPTTDRSPDTDDEVADDATGTPAAEDPPPTPELPTVSEEPSDPPPPPPGPSDPPSEPSDECTDVVAVLDCVLNPITAQP